MTCQPWQTSEQLLDAPAGIAMGRISLGIVNTASQPVRSADGNLLVVMDGELYDHDGEKTRLEAQGCRFSDNSHAEILLHGYMRHGQTYFRDLNGKFAAAIWDAGKRRLIVVNDRFGMKPIYYAHVPNKLVVASEIKAILTHPDVPSTPSMRGLSQFFSFGHYLGEDTSFEAIRLLPAAGCLTYDVDEDTLSVNRYWQLSASAANGCSEAELLARIDEVFKLAVDRRVNGTNGLGLSLSGGLDARTILGVMDHDRVALTTVAMGMPGCRDHRSATELAARTNRNHHNYVLKADFLAGFEQHLRQMVHLTDGQYLSQCIVMPTLPFYREQGIGVLLRGNAGELMHMNKAYNFSLDREAFALRGNADLEDWAFKHLRAYMLAGVDGPLFATTHGNELETLARESLQDCLQESAGIEPPVQRISHLFFTQRSRRETALSLVKFGSVVETRLPYLDNELIDLLMATPPELKMGETIQAAILRRHRPEFLDVINVNTGTRMGAGELARKLAGLKQKVFAKLGVRGYQPYERLGLWLRQDLRPLVEEILLSDRCLERGLFHPDTTRGIVDQHAQRTRNHTFLIMAMMICELGQRMFVDGDEPNGL
ncbi:MAG: asparagine synthetase B family protein [Pirellulaceae bacterium]